jgi:hypothetical protein
VATTIVRDYFGWQSVVKQPSKFLARTKLSEPVQSINNDSLRFAEEFVRTLTVFNTLGQQVAQLVNEQQSAGYHDVVFHGDELASGVYVYRLHAGDFVALKKFVLLR